MLYRMDEEATVSKPWSNN